MEHDFLQTIKKCPFVVCIVCSVLIVSVIGFFGTISGKFDAKVSFLQPYTAIVLNRSAQTWAAPDEYEEGVIVKTTPHHYLEVEDEWFQDALFIGDTGIAELSAYGGLDTATYAYQNDLSTSNVWQNDLHVSTLSKDMSLSDLLKENTYSKIYIMMGTNDLSDNDPDAFEVSYKELMEQIRELQPDTTFFLLSIPAVTTACSEEEKLYQNNMIYAYNYEIKGLTDDENALYFNLNQVCCDTSGALKEEYTTDGIHLRAEYYPLWTSYIKEHGIE